MNDVFITENFMPRTDAAVRLYHEYARDVPIIDYHCHVPPGEIAADKRWENLTQIWLYGDHYKWRLMRAAGVDERYCTGDASDWEKFVKWCDTMPKTLCNPVYVWSHMELKRPFGVSDRMIGPETAKSIWDDCAARLAEPEFSCRGIMKQMNVRLVCTTDDPVDSLEHHAAIAADPSFDVRVLPAWRPDKGMAVETPEVFNAWVDALAAAANIDIVDLQSYMDAIGKRHEFFHASGCRLSDHGLETIYADPYTQSEVAAIFNKVRGGAELTESDVLKFKSAMLHEFAVMDCDRGWTQQFHVGAMRGNNTRMLKELGPDTGFDSIGDFELGRPLSRFLDRLDIDGKLAKTILYNLNPVHNGLLASMIGNFMDGRTPGKIQFGGAWWFLDQKNGMTEQMAALSNMGLLSRFVGMLTDSRSFLSYTRHEYFRRLLCDILGTEMSEGLLPSDYDLVGGMVEDICYNNAAEYFGFDLDT